MPQESKKAERQGAPQENARQRLHRRQARTKGCAGIIADTHGLLRPEAMAALTGVDVIIHAGDIGKPEILTALSALAPVVAVRGNNDHGAWAEALPETAVVPLGNGKLYVIHDFKQLACDPVTEGYAAVICGHSHQPHLETRQGVLFMNPGSAGPRRFKLPIAVGRLSIRAGVLQPEILHLVGAPVA